MALNNFAKESGKGAIDSLILKEAKFIYMNFEPIFVVLGCERTDEIDTMKERLNIIGTLFINTYGNLENWDGEVRKFRSFSEILDKELKPEYTPITIAPKLSKEELIIREYDDVSAEFTCEIIKNEKSKINVFLSRSLEEHFIVNIDFKEFPEKPKIKFPKELKKLLGKPEDALLTFANWNPENPAKIVEILRELEHHLIKSTQKNDYSTRIIVDKNQPY
jgi:hypothetical protein